MKRCLWRCLSLVLSCISFNLMSFAQIGYQVSLLDKDTGLPRAGETVGVTVEITDSNGAIIITEEQQATTDNFGLLSLKIGNADTFRNVDWNKLPLWISAKVDDVVIGRSQILNVPVAEYAKRVGSLTKEILCSKWPVLPNGIKLSNDGTFSYSHYEVQDMPGGPCFYKETISGTYNIISGLIVHMKGRRVVSTCVGTHEFDICFTYLYDEEMNELCLQSEWLRDENNTYL